MMRTTKRARAVLTGRPSLFKPRSVLHPPSTLQNTPPRRAPVPAGGFTLLELVVAMTLLVSTVLSLQALVSLQAKQVGTLEQARQDVSVADLTGAKAVFTDTSDGLPVYELELVRIDCCPTCIAQCLDPQSATATVRQWER